jgi:hypothetical protein
MGPRAQRGAPVYNNYIRYKDFSLKFVHYTKSSKTINRSISRNYVTGNYNITNKKRHSFSWCRFFPGFNIIGIVTFLYIKVFHKPYFLM